MIATLYEQWSAARREADKIHDESEGLPFGPKTRAIEARAAAVEKRAFKLAEKIEKAKATTLADVTAKLRIAAWEIGNAPYDMEDKLTLSALADVERLVKERAA